MLALLKLTWVIINIHLLTSAPKRNMDKQSRRGSQIDKFLNCSMSASKLDEPFVVSTYTSTVGRKKPKEYLPNTFVFSHRRPGKQEECVTAVVQSDGVHIIDVSDLVCG